MIQNSREWDAIRLGRFTASQLDTLCTQTMAKTSMSYIEDVAIEIVTGNSYNASSKQMDWGHEYEDEARKWYSVTHFVDVEEIFFIAIEDFAGASPDGRAGDIHLEIKCPYTPRQHWKNMKMTSWEHLRKMNRAYYHQIQFTQWAMDVELTHFFSYRPDFPSELKGFTLEVPRNEETIQFILDRLLMAEELLQKELKGKVEDVAARRAEIQRPGYPYIHSRLDRREGGGWTRSDMVSQEASKTSWRIETQTWDNPFSLY